MYHVCDTMVSDLKTEYRNSGRGWMAQKSECLGRREVERPGPAATRPPGIPWIGTRNKAKGRKCQIAPLPPGVIPAGGGWATWRLIRRAKQSQLPGDRRQGRGRQRTKRAKQSQTQGKWGIWGDADVASGAVSPESGACETKPIPLPNERRAEPTGQEYKLSKTIVRNKANFRIAAGKFLSPPPWFSLNS
jgi:hypothetical protein